MKHHLRFRNFHPRTVGAAERLFLEKPWRLPNEDQERVAQDFLVEVAETYKVSVPQFAIDPYQGLSQSYIPAVRNNDSLDTETILDPAGISLNQFSILTLFAMSRLHMLAEGMEAVGEDDSLGWACSLFYRVKPVMFRARAREGRVQGVTARDTYSLASWLKLEDAGVTDDNWLTISPRAAKDIINEAPRPSDEEPAMIDTQDSDPVGTYAGERDPAALPDDGLDSLNRDEIRRLASANGIPRGNKNKAELIEALRAAQVSA